MDFTPVKHMTWQKDHTSHLILELCLFPHLILTMTIGEFEHCSTSTKFPNSFRNGPEDANRIVSSTFGAVYANHDVPGFLFAREFNELRLDHACASAQTYSVREFCRRQKIIPIISGSSSSLTVTFHITHCSVQREVFNSYMKKAVDNDDRGPQMTRVYLMTYGFESRLSHDRGDSESNVPTFFQQAAFKMLQSQSHLAKNAEVFKFYDDTWNDGTSWSDHATTHLFFKGIRSYKRQIALSNQEKNTI